MSIAGKVDDTPPGLRVTLGKRFLTNLTVWLKALVSTDRVRAGGPRPAWARPSWLIAGGVVVVATVVATMYWLDSPAIAHQRTLTAKHLDLFEAITGFGQSGWILFPMAGLVALLAGVSSPALGRIGQLVVSALVARIGFVFIAVALPGLVVTIVKRLLGRARPYSWETGGAFNFEPFRWQVEYASLPSGHGTTAFAAAFALATIFPRLRFAFWTLAVMIGASRIALSAHYPSDVIAGAFVGVLGAIVARNWFAVRRLGFYVAPDRSVRLMPGPSFRRLYRVTRQLFSRA